MVDIAKLTVRLEAENAKLTKALTKSSGDIKRFEGQAKKSVKAVRSAFGGIFAGIGAGLALRGLTSAVNRTLDANDRIAKLSQTTGLLVEDLNALDLAARITGTNMESLTKGVGRLQRNMFDSVAGLKESKEAFEALDVAVQNQDGTLRDTQDVLLDVADKFAGIEDGAGKAALAQRLFGRAGTNLIPFLNQGAGAIAGYVAEQRKLGNVLTDEVAKASERVNDNFTRLDVAQEGVSRSLTTGMLPALESITEELVNMSKGTNSASEDFGEFAGNFLRLGTTAAVVVGSAFTILGDTIGRVAAATVSIATGEFSRAWEIISDDGADLIQTISDRISSIDAIWTDVAADVAAGAEANSEKLAAPIILAAEKTAKATGKIKKTIDDLAFDAIELQFAALDKEEAAKLAGTAGPTANQQQAAAIFEATRTPAENLSTTIEELNALLDAGDISFDTYSRAMFDAQDEMDGLAEKADDTGDKLSVFAEQAARNMQDDFAEFLFDPFVEDGLKGMLDGFVTTLRQMAAQAAAAQIFESLGAGLSGQGGFFGGIGDFITGATTRASGGPLAANQLALVGESGPELFIPDRPGTVVANNDIGGLQPITINVTQPPSQGTGQSASQFGLEIAQALRVATGRNG